MVQLFSKQSEGLENYKNNFLQALKKSDGIFSDELIAFLEKYIQKQTSYIPRDDVNNLGKNLDYLLENDELKKEFKNKLNKLNSENMIEYAFNSISLLDDIIKNFLKSEKQRKKEEKIKKEIELQKKKDEQELEKLENLLDEL